MGFQILNTDKQPIKINELDSEAAAFWNKELLKDQYATPFLGDDSVRGILAQGSNWFDMIGYAIHSPCHQTTGWDNVKCTLWIIQIGSLGYKTEDEQRRGVASAQAYLEPYFKLIDHWQSRGYIPVKTDD